MSNKRCLFHLKNVDFQAHIMLKIENRLIERFKDRKHDAVAAVRLSICFGFEIQLEQCANASHCNFIILQTKIWLLYAAKKVYILDL